MKTHSYEPLLQNPQAPTSNWPFSPTPQRIRQLQSFEHHLYLASFLMFAIGGACFVSGGFVELYRGDAPECAVAPCQYDYLYITGSTSFIVAALLDAFATTMHQYFDPETEMHRVEVVQVASCAFLMLGATVQLVELAMSSHSKPCHDWSVGSMIVEATGLAALAVAVMLDVISKQMHLYYKDPEQPGRAVSGCISEYSQPDSVTIKSTNDEPVIVLPFRVLKDHRTRAWVNVAGGNIFFLGISVELMATAIGILAAVRGNESHVWSVTRHSYLGGLIAGEFLVVCGALIEAVCYL